MWSTSRSLKPPPIAFKTRKTLSAPTQTQHRGKRGCLREKGRKGKLSYTHTNNQKGFSFPFLISRSWGALYYLSYSKPTVRWFYTPRTVRDGSEVDWELRLRLWADFVICLLYLLVSDFFQTKWTLLLFPDSDGVLSWCLERFTRFKSQVLRDV